MLQIAPLLPACRLSWHTWSVNASVAGVISPSLSLASSSISGLQLRDHQLMSSGFRVLRGHRSWRTRHRATLAPAGRINIWRYLAGKRSALNGLEASTGVGIHRIQTLYNISGTTQSTQLFWKGAWVTSQRPREALNHQNKAFPNLDASEMGLQRHGVVISHRFSVYPIPPADNPFGNPLF
jgi:hypothetical protein